MHARYKDYVSGGLHLKKLRDPDGGVHLARKKVLMGIADEIKPAITVEFSTFNLLLRAISVPSGVCFVFLFRAFSIICMFFNILVS